MDRPRVSVLMGGPSAEHAISLKSGQGVAAALTHRGWPVDSVVIPQDVTVEEASRYARLALEPHGPDVVFIALHGPFGEDGTIQHLCEELHLGYTGSDPKASRLGLDKVESRKRFEQAGLGAALASRGSERMERDRGGNHRAGISRRRQADASGLQHRRVPGGQSRPAP